MSIDLDLIELRTREEITRYQYTVPRGALGTPWTDATVQCYLKELLSSLVPRYIAKVRMNQSFDLIGSDTYDHRECAIVADPKDGYLLFYDPVTDQFGVADQRHDELFDVGIPRDAVEALWLADACRRQTLIKLNTPSANQPLKHLAPHNAEPNTTISADS